MSAALIARILALTPGWGAQAEAAGIDMSDVSQILDEAEKISTDVLGPLGRHADVEGCRIAEGRVKVPEGYRDTFRRLGQDGWIAADLPPEMGGMGLPLALHTAASLGFEGAAMPYMMLHGSTRAGAHMLVQSAPEIAAIWAPMLAAGDWAATICISEPDAGSDVGRIRTKASGSDGNWLISGTKCWISFGDHDMTDRIGHLCLARTGAPEDGTRGLSLFLIPDMREDGSRNGIHLERIEEKLGLHGSPTCVLRFEAAQGTLIGEQNRGLAVLFGMIELMRLQVGGQGAGVALAAAALARRYAAERRQGGHPARPPVPISDHPDVARQLRLLDTRAALLTALITETAVAVQDGKTNAESEAYAAFLLPIAKTFCGEGAQANASGAIQILGGAGYTRDWPAERLFRDARILTIYEGTTGMQAQDLLLRRLIREDGAGLRVFLRRARAEAPGLAILDRFEALAAHVSASDAQAQLRHADAVLRAGWEAVSAMLARRLVAAGEDLADSGHLWLHASEARFAVHEAEIHAGGSLCPDRGL